MGLEVIFSDLQSLLTSFSEDAKSDIDAYLDDIVLDNSERNILNLYEPNPKFDMLKKNTSDELVQKMHILTRNFNMEMINLLSSTENKFRKTIREAKK